MNKLSEKMNKLSDILASIAAIAIVVGVSSIFIAIILKISMSILWW